MTKLSALTIVLLGVSIAVVALSWAFFQAWMPNKTEAGYWNTYTEQLQVEANKLAVAERRRETAIEMVELKAAEWSAVAATRTPSESLATGGISLAVNPYQLTVDARKFRNSAQRAVNAQMKRGGITVINGPAVPFPPETAATVLNDYFNFPQALPFPVVMFDFGTVTVRGSYRQISVHMRAWANMPNYLAVTDGLQIQGSAPNPLTATYSLSIVGFIRGKDVFPSVSGQGGGTQAGTGGMPAPAGPPGGVPAAPKGNALVAE